MTTGEMIKRIRFESHMTQSEFAKAINCNQAFLSYCENGIKKPSISTAKKIIALAKSNKIKIKLEDLFPDDTEKN